MTGDVAAQGAATSPVISHTTVEGQTEPKPGDHDRDPARQQNRGERAKEPVSYTHLTLPTILRV